MNNSRVNQLPPNMIYDKSAATNHIESRIIIDKAFAAIISNKATSHKETISKQLDEPAAKKVSKSSKVSEKHS
jgi:hypothetical protein